MQVFSLAFNTPERRLAAKAIAAYEPDNLPEQEHRQGGQHRCLRQCAGMSPGAIAMARWSA
jgi:hypothetical protein